MNFLFEKKLVGVVYLLSLFLLFSISFSEAAVDTSRVEDVFEVNDIIQYSKPCSNNGTYCGPTAVCNYTFYDTDNTIRVNNQIAINVGANGSSIWQYNISHDTTGLYKVDMFCTDAGLKGSTTMYYQVTGDGNNTSLGFYALILLLSFGIVIFGFVIKDAWMTMLGSMGLYFFGLYVLFNGIAGTKDAITTWGIGIIILGVAMYISIQAGMEVMDSQ